MVDNKLKRVENSKIAEEDVQKKKIKNIHSKLWLIYSV